MFELDDEIKNLEDRLDVFKKLDSLAKDQEYNHLVIESMKPELFGVFIIGYAVWPEVTRFTYSHANQELKFGGRIICD